MGNGASCTESTSDCSIRRDRYTRTCAKGFLGKSCESDLDECASTPCLNGATCSQAVNSYKCTCASGYTDTPIGTCFTELDECSSAPCKNSGTCFDHAFAYSCICARGYSGYNCESDDDDCASSPCMNGATCADSVDKFSCTCGSGWAGSTCGNEVDACIKTENNCDKLRAECVHVGVGY